MTFFKNKKEELSKFLWKLKVERNLSRESRFRQSISVEKAKTIGIYSIYENAEQFAGVLKFANSFQQSGKVVKMLVYIPDLQDVKEEASFMESLLPLQINFIKFPRKTAAKVQHFIYNDFDILFDTSPAFHYIDVSVMSASNAKFKVGKSGEINSRVNDLSMSFSEGASQQEMLQTMLEYLRIF